MQLFKTIWVFVLQIADYPAKLGDELSSSLFGTRPAALTDVYAFPPARKSCSVHKSCTNSPQHRECWYGDFCIDTDYEKYTPHTGKTNYYTLEITNAPWHGDGYQKNGMLINGSYPGPTIEGNWGDNFHITVHNRLTNYNGTSIHWHGIRQLHTNLADGVPGVTQCPIPQSSTMVYEFQALQYGTSWYHSHFSLQYPDGIVGPIVIHGPTSANYDIDLGPLLLTDWYHKDAFSLEQTEFLGKKVESAPSKLMNGCYGRFKCIANDPNCDPKKACTYTVNFVKGKKYKWGVVNTSAGSGYTFWIDGHTFTVVQVDFVPIKPYKTDHLNIGIGQRYDIIVEANANTKLETDFWINMRDCQLTASVDSPYTGIIRYDPKSTRNPSVTAPDPGSQNCADAPLASLVPVVPWELPKVPPFTQGNSLYVANYEVTLGGAQVFNWELANDSLYIDWEKPGLSYAGIGEKSPEPFPLHYAPLFVNGKDDDWAYYVIEGNFSIHDITHGKPIPGVAHPIHLHGHDFVILAQEFTEFDANNYTLITKNPPRRDVALLPASGYLIIGFRTDNPGIWLMHCHIAFHASAGLAVQFVEREKEISKYMSKDAINKYKKQCADWKTYYGKSPAKQADSGI